MSAGNECNGLLVVHRHAAECFPNVLGGGDWIWLRVRPFRIHVDQTHLNRGERILEFPVARVTFVVKPLVLRSPVNILLRLPDINPPSGESKRLEPHRLEGDVASENHQVGPRNLLTILLLDRPEQPTRFVEVGVVRPAIERRKTLCAGRGATAAICDAIRACTVPGHPNEKRTIVPIVGWPPVL